MSCHEEAAEGFAPKCITLQLLGSMHNCGMVGVLAASQRTTTNILETVINYFLLYFLQFF